MSISHPSSAFNAQIPAAARRALPNWLREPLLHFVVAGGLLFAADHFIVGRADDRTTIVVGA
jgi:hypothetical protein